ncbi:MAG: hybrid sensor histidine kinase/response regulator, partial [Gammaproteobacteria bacterium]
TKKAGSGLGLATVYSIIKKHGGYITVQSELGKGTTFSLYLPAIELTEEEEAPLVEEEKSTVRSGKVLVMDDDEMILSLVTSILEIHNYSVTTAVDGEQAIQLYQQSLDQQQPYDAVIMDLTIPGGMGGKDAVQEVLKIDSNAKCIVSSGYADDPIIANFQQYGFKGVVSKPFAVKDLTELLDKII